MFAEDEFILKNIIYDVPGGDVVIRRFPQPRVRFITNLRNLTYISSKWTYPKVIRCLRSDMPFKNTTEIMLYSLYSIEEFRRAR